MVIEDIIPTLPKKKEGIENAYKNCCKNKKFIPVKKDNFSVYLEKAKSDLSNTKTDFGNQAWDGVIIKCYYAIHHAINALLVKSQGFYSKDHICAILALNYLKLISESFYKKLREINTKFSDFTGFEISYSLRKLSQYDVLKWKSINKKDAEQIYSLAKELILFVEVECYK
ncbi:HEPN domain-containing protein [Candidatus Pacearchaeota archaeon]|nr:HEPN domain-containing protein [Candidatus Pacearchaeota archaeon]